MPFPTSKTFPFNPKIIKATFQNSISFTKWEVTIFLHKNDSELSLTKMNPQKKKYYSKFYRFPTL